MTRMNAMADPNGQLRDLVIWSYKAGDIIVMLVPPSNTGVTYAFMHRMKTSMVPAAIPGVMTGIDTRKKVLIRLAPKLRAASSREKIGSAACRERVGRNV